MDLEYNPLDYDVQEDPYPYYARLRAEAPVYYNEKLDFFALSRHADVAPALRDSDRFSNENGPLMEREYWKPDSARHHSIVAMDPPDHARWRRLISGSFSPRAIGRLEVQVRELSRLAVEAAVERGTFDVMQDVIYPIPMDALGIVVGVPKADRPEVQRLLEGTVHREDGATTIGPAQMQAFQALSGYYAELVEERRKQPAEDLISDLLASEIDGKPLETQDVLAFLHLLGGASTVTTIDLIGNAWYWAWRNPDQQQAALAGDVNGWVEETLRYDSPVQMVIRKSKVDLELHGVQIPAGAQVLMLMGAANRDSAEFPGADEFDLTRDASQLLSFSRGPHLCLGNLMGRRVARIVLEELVNRVADYDLDPDGLVRVHRSTVRGFRKLPTVITLR
ncbi:cytochrome P450 [Actinosynnema sp. NPDC047251]|uniref:Cytochrome P450 family protein n=1 Tax=Saccharothrix espanaensis (strain ATCC 51144 / DSM 44229 / JCM 9112 / NBRC 15066 / NRRL 15764) TaxID=1179773 RepID=K0JTT5_SACES|nr:cytochrome P450 [Saccharothrix espanaensis]CCH31200.1 Cytochrome P450 family protein [Saccharothrix espanaensis DSM 44229]